MLLNSSVTPSRIQSASVGALFTILMVFASTAMPAVRTMAAVKSTTPAATVAPRDIQCLRTVTAPMVKLAVGKSTLIRPAKPIVRVLLGNPERASAARPTEAALGASTGTPQNPLAADVSGGRRGAADVDVLVLGPDEIFLLGKTIGSTNVVLVDRDSQCTMLDIAVDADTSAVQATFAELLPAETSLKVSSIGGSLVLSGTVTDALAVEHAMDIATAYLRRTTPAQGVAGRSNDAVVNMLAVSAPQQVMLEVKVAEISKTLLDRFGLNFSRAYSPADGSMLRFLSGVFGGTGAIIGQVGNTAGATVGGGVVSSLTNGSSTAVITGPAAATATGSGTVMAATGTSSSVALVDALKKDGLIKILAEPTVIAISGQEGSFLAGGKILIPISIPNGTGGTSYTLQEKEFGVSLKFTPTVMAGGRINLRVAQELSELNLQGISLSAPGVSGVSILPSFTSRKAATTVQLFDGQSFAIGGLIKNNVTSTISRFPLLGDLPVIGALFRSSDFQTDRSELVFVVTPRLVKAMPGSDIRLPTDDYAPPTPNEFFLQGNMTGTSKPADAQPATAPSAQK